MFVIVSLPITEQTLVRLLGFYLISLIFVFSRKTMDFLHTGMLTEHGT